MGNKAKIKQIDPSQIRYTPQEGEVIRDMKGNYLTWHDGEWMTLQMENSGIEMGLYEMNKQIIEQMPLLSPEEIEDRELLIYGFHAKWYNVYYMLYGKDISYFTLFKIGDNAKPFGYDVIDCLTSIGGIKAIDETAAGDSLEIWVQTEDGPTCLYLFPYDNGVVKVGE